ncbi:ankyrin repeat domain-containing protein [Hoeflea prorocentri]|uniref:Ankyrin repeat domain-containing protein n=1 Tax=Hoeflea prorocentri TaxID=1922333 RepID=A0A9X3UHX9_9HYPH|nr:ankyrin repeat domain-containing protein [Hoeflea prorocentri]MCY6380992.1 hypothetical protein [Hoeflea prorocentri]MDA5398792.1 hypothetical protein [Hoeflea prorocentri]
MDWNKIRTQCKVVLLAGVEYPDLNGSKFQLRGKRMSTANKITIVVLVLIAVTALALSVGPFRQHMAGPKADCPPYATVSTPESMLQAIREKELVAVNCILDAGYEIDAIIAHGDTALDEAAYFGRVEIVEELLRRGASVNAGESSTIIKSLLSSFDEDVFPGLPVASEADHFRIGEILLNNGSRVDDPFNEEFKAYDIIISQYCRYDNESRTTYEDFLSRLERSNLPDIRPDMSRAPYIEAQVYRAEAGITIPECVYRSFKAFRIKFN